MIALRQRLEQAIRDHGLRRVIETLADAAEAEAAAEKEREDDGEPGDSVPLRRQTIALRDLARRIASTRHSGAPGVLGDTGRLVDAEHTYRCTTAIGFDSRSIH